MGVGAGERRVVSILVADVAGSTSIDVQLDSLPGDPTGTGGFVPPTMPGHSHRVAAGLRPRSPVPYSPRPVFPMGQAYSPVPKSFPVVYRDAEIEDLGPSVRPELRSAPRPA